MTSPTPPTPADADRGCQVCAEGRDCLCWHAAVEWASRREREWAAAKIHETKEETIRQLIHAGYDEPRRIKKFVAMMDGLRDMLAPGLPGGTEGGGKAT